MQEWRDHETSFIVLSTYINPRVPLRLEQVLSQHSLALCDDLSLDREEVWDVVVLALVSDRRLSVAQASYFDDIKSHGFVIWAVKAVPIHSQKRRLNTCRILLELWRLCSEGKGVFIFGRGRLFTGKTCIDIPVHVLRRAIICPDLHSIVL